MTTKVSIILPTYNRADTICRAIKSVQAQTFQDWELIVIDDGSTDDTEALITLTDPRMVLIRQENRGFTEARNAGIRASTGTYLAFLDSDDEFLPHHLELCVAYLEAFPGAQFVGTELLEDLGKGRLVNHYRMETSEIYPKAASRIGSHMLDLPPGETDDYLRVYQSREPIGEWGSEIIERAGYGQQRFIYSGMIFEYLRWGFLITITATVIRRSALETIGLPEPSRGTGSDFHFMATLCRNFQTSFLSVPTFVKHELNTEGRLPALGHVVSGATALRFEKDWLYSWEDLFWHDHCDDPELGVLRGLRQFSIAKTALQFGCTDEALSYLQETRKSLPGVWQVSALSLFVRCLPRPNLAQRVWNGWNKGVYAAKQLLRGQLPLRVFVRKALTGLK